MSIAKPVNPPAKVDSKGVKKRSWPWSMAFFARSKLANVMAKIGAAATKGGPTPL
jgi:hypothetical protein